MLKEAGRRGEWKADLARLVKEEKGTVKMCLGESAYERGQEKRAASFLSCR